MALLLQDGSYLLVQQASAPVGVLLVRGDPGAIYHTLAPSWRTANFGDGTTTVSWTSPLDPGERKTYTIDCTTELNAIEDRILSVTVTLSALASLAGLRIYGVTNDQTQVTVWFEIAAADRSRPGWNDPGEVHFVTVSVMGMSGHTFERMASITVKNLE
jgi:hypothetical protein